MKFLTKIEMLRKGKDASRTIPMLSFKGRKKEQ